MQKSDNFIFGRSQYETEPYCRVAVDVDELFYFSYSGLSTEVVNVH